MGRPAARVPTKIRHPLAAVGLQEFKYISQECQDLLEELEEEAEEQGRTHESDPYSGETLDCKTSEQACTFKLSIYGENLEFGKCFPAVCKQANIFKEAEAGWAGLLEEGHASGLDVSCVSSGEGSTTREPWQEYLSEECHDRLVKLEKKAEKEMRRHEWN